MPGYIDLYMLPVQEDKQTQYVELASRFRQILLDHGALNYREFKADDLTGQDGNIPFSDRIELRDGEILTCAVAEFESRQHRDQVMDAAMEDERMKPMMEAEPYGRMSAMSYGGFETFVGERHDIPRTAR